MKKKVYDTRIYFHMRKLDKEKLMALSKFEGVATNVLIRKLIDNYIDTMENQMTLFKLSEQQKNA